MADILEKHIKDLEEFGCKVSFDDNNFIYIEHECGTVVADELKGEVTVDWKVAFHVLYRIMEILDSMIEDEIKEAHRQAWEEWEKYEQEQANNRTNRSGIEEVRRALRRGHSVP